MSDSQWNNLQPGIFEFGTDLEEKIISVENQFFQTYQMITAVSPLEVALYQTGFVPFAVSESGGTTGELTLVDASSLRFQAEGGVPEPSTFVLLGVGLAGLIAVMRKQRVT